MALIRRGTVQDFTQVSSVCACACVPREGEYFTRGPPVDTLTDSREKFCNSKKGYRAIRHTHLAIIPYEHSKQLQMALIINSMEKLIVIQLVTKFPAFGTQRFITVFTRFNHWSLSWAT